MGRATRRAMRRWSPTGSACPTTRSIWRRPAPTRSRSGAERGKRFAAHFMEADAADIAFADGAFTIAGTDRSMPILQVAQMSFIPVGLPSQLGVGLQGAGEIGRASCRERV